MFDIIIVGGGHAGVEAAHIASQFENLKIGILTLPKVGLASAPCNPSIGGVGKGQVVRELDALGGVIGKLADKSGLQFRILNESKGYAVQSTRIQIDKLGYSVNAEKEIDLIPNIDVLRGKVVNISNDDGYYTLHTEDDLYSAKKIIITVGTFLNGKMHTGSEQSTGGRISCESSNSLAEFFKDIKTVSARFKTGTPARLNINSIDYSVLTEQASDDEVETFHVLHGTKERFIGQKSCYIAYTNSNTMKIIRDNKEKSPLFNGQIQGVGARYCPSIEDKAYRYPDKDVHHVFIEPESHNLNTVYPSGISSSLPREIQDEMVQSIEGLESVKIEEYGYAVEYDVIDTTQLNYSLEYKEMKGLYFAGQVNGTSGYEEAAGQGYIAGVNAALDILGKKPLVLSRNDSYIGVMIEDLISNVRDEPYRLFTARSENRLYIREDNTITRMNKYRSQLGLAKEIDLYNNKFEDDYITYTNLLNETYISESDKFLKEIGLNVPRRMTVSEVVKQASLNPIDTLKKYFVHCSLVVDDRLSRCLAISIKYDGYINKAKELNYKLSKMDKYQIEWKELVDSENISFECKQRIGKIKPTSFGQLKLIEGIRPATLAAVAGSF
jgi:tRNA uridine 5-carboxymethylaminomethyl modification enzyme